MNTLQIAAFVVAILVVGLLTDRNPYVGAFVLALFAMVIGAVMTFAEWSQTAKLHLSGGER